MEPIIKDFIDFTALLIASIWIVVALRLRLIKRVWIVVVTALIIMYPLRAFALYLWA